MQLHDYIASPEKSDSKLPHDLQAPNKSIHKSYQKEGQQNDKMSKL